MKHRLTLLLACMVLAAVLVSSALAVCIPPPSDLVSWWDGDNVSGITAFDIQGPNDGTMFGGLGTATGLVGSAFDFDGSNDYISVSNEANFDFERNDSFTFITWIKTNKTTVGVLTYLFGKWNISISPFPGYLFGINTQTDGSIQLTLVGVPSGALTVVKGSTKVNDGNWHHVVYQNLGNDGSASDIRLYVDGSLETMTTIADTMGNGSILHNFPLIIGSRRAASETHGLRMDGLMDEIQVFDRALTALEIQLEYNASSAGKCKGPAPAPACGNGIVEAGESCDDGNTFSADGCSSTCQIETPVCAVPPSGLVSWWPLDETGGNITQDIQDGNDGTVNGPVYAPGKAANGLDFDGVDDYVSVADSANLEPSQITVDAWVKADSLSDIAAHVVDKLTFGSQGYALEIGPGGLASFELHTSGSGTVAATGTTNILGDGRFHHLAGTYDGSTVRIYVDGVPEGSASASGPIIYSGTFDVTIGDNNPSQVRRRLDGIIDEVEIYNRSLTTPEIEDIFNSSTAGKCKPEICGNGVIEAGETCDDGNLISEDGCSDLCLLEVCGDGVLQGGLGEECDDGNGVGGDGCSLICTNETGACLAPPSGLVSWWTGDTNGSDFTGKNDGILTSGATAGASGFVGGAFSFDGVNDYVNAGKDLSLKLRRNFTVQGWVNPDTFGTNVRTIVSHGMNCNSPRMWEIFIMTSGQLGFFFSTGFNYISTISTSSDRIFVTNKWQHFAVVYDLGTISFYLNGQNIGNNTDFAGSPTGTNTRDFRIGRWYCAAGKNFDGLIDEVQVFNRSLSAAEIKAEFDAGSEGKCKGGDTDGDGVIDDADNCPAVFNPDQSDLDSQDGGDVCDLCPDDATDLCDTSFSAGETVGSDGGIVNNSAGEVTMAIPSGALSDNTSISLTKGGSNFQVTIPGRGGGTVLYEYTLGPPGATFDEPVALTFIYDPGAGTPSVFKDEGAGFFDLGFDCTSTSGVCTGTVTSFSTFALIIPTDSDNDTVPDNFDNVSDLCNNTVLPEVLLRELRPGHFADIDGDGIFETIKGDDDDDDERGTPVDSKFTLADTDGCSCLQILEFKPRDDDDNDDEEDEEDDDDGVLGEQKFGCTKGTMKTFIKRKGWAKDITGSVVLDVSASTWLGIISVLSIIALVIVSLSAFQKMGKKR